MRFVVTGSLCMILIAGACGEDGFRYQGTAGTETATRFPSWVPSVQVSIDDHPPKNFLVDTGAPLTMLDTDSFGGVSDGRHEVSLGGFGLTFPDYPVVAFDVFRYEQDPSAGFAGIIGGDLLSHFALTIDYQGDRIWLSESGDESFLDGVDSTATLPAVSLSAPVRGGGVAIVPGSCPSGCGTIDTPPTRVLLQVLLEDVAEPLWMIVDSGASAVVLEQSVIDELLAVDRPVLRGVTVGTASGTVIAYFTRVRSLALAAADGGAPLEESSVSVLVLPDDTLLSGAYAEIGLHVRGLVGASFLRSFLTTIDYPAARIRLARYAVQTHLDPREFIRVGFTMQLRGGAWEIGDVYSGTDADNEGLRSGDEVVQLGGVDMSGKSRSEVSALLDDLDLGDEISVSVRSGGTVITVQVTVEDLLPRYEAP